MKMKILYKYVLDEIIKIFFIILLGIVLFILISVMLDEITGLLSYKPSAMLLVNYFAFKVPFLTAEALPFAMLLSILYVFSQLNRHNELNAMKSAGINFYRIITPVLVFSLCVSLLAIVLNETIVSRAYEKSTYIKEVLIQKKTGPTADIRKDLAKLSSGGRVFYIKYFDGLLGVMKGICILKVDTDFNLLERIDASDGVWVKNKWILKNVAFRTFKNNVETKIEAIKELALDITETPGDFTVQRKSPEDTLTVNIFRLYKLIKLLKESGFSAGEEEVNLHLKIAFPFASFILALLGVTLPFLFTTSRSFVNTALGFVFTIIVSFFYMGFVTIGLSLGRVAVMSPVLAAWIANIVFIVLGFGMLLRVKR